MEANAPTPNPSDGDLKATIDGLRDLADDAESTLKSLSSIISLTYDNAAAGLIRCPYNPHHRMPPESLFRHSLICPDSPGAGIDDLSFLQALRYPSSLADRRRESAFIQSLPDVEAELCFSMDAELGDLGINFFYKDCPGIVTTPEPDTAPKTFTLPGFLSTECANFVGGGCEESSLGVWDGFVGILPSDYWALKCEVEGWSGIPSSYSYFVLEVTSSLGLGGGFGSRRCVMSNSPKFGILIDGAMGEHICLLLNLCLKAIGREARDFVRQLSSKGGLCDPKCLTFQCIRLVGSLTWFASQLSLLYGDVNGKLFANAMLKESLLKVAFNLSLSKPSGEKFDPNCSQNVDRNCLNNHFHECESVGLGLVGEPKNEVLSQGYTSGHVFVSQVASAIAALHERSMLEEKIRALRFSQPVVKSQRILEYMYASTRGCEERAKRPNYRPVVEYDGLLWLRSQNQAVKIEVAFPGIFEFLKNLYPLEHKDIGKIKTKEELLAEERDYKRRRVSYRGKKVKRNPTEVLRDIIDEHMEEIKQAGGSKSDLRIVEGKTVSGETARLDDMQNFGIDLSKTRSKSSSSNVVHHADAFKHDESRMSRTILDGDNKSEFELYERRMNHDRNRHERHKYHRSRSPSIQRNGGSSHDQLSHKAKISGVKNNPKYERSDSHYSYRSKDSLTRLSSKSSRTDYDYKSRTRNKTIKDYEDSRPQSETNVFEDRYEPDGSYDDYDVSNES